MHIYFCEICENGVRSKDIIRLKREQNNVDNYCCVCINGLIERYEKDGGLLGRGTSQRADRFTEDEGRSRMNDILVG
tara:strand:- start:286 stop:516 length:231 start_codon:yes stop_codon:yes gene_type:complete